MSDLKQNIERASKYLQRFQGATLGHFINGKPVSATPPHKAPDKARPTRSPRRWAAPTCPPRR